jgi:XTP/dITP diphosphohydrolase
MPELVLSTRNEHKLREFSELLPGWQMVSLPSEFELPPETGDSFAANALVKAEAAAEETGMPAIADDSGICASALDGAPGIFSARFAGAQASDGENLAKLISDVFADGGSDTAVEYVCAIAYAEPDGETKIFEGRCSGKLIEQPRGDGGFGYDPAVIPDDYSDDRTMAELSQAEKDAISHRGRADRDLLLWLDTR